MGATIANESLPPRGGDRGGVPRSECASFGGSRDAVEGAYGSGEKKIVSPQRILPQSPAAPAFARVASIACFPLWLKICHRHIFLTRRALPEGALPRKSAPLNSSTNQNLKGYEILGIGGRAFLTIGNKCKNLKRIVKRHQKQWIWGLCGGISAEKE